MIVASGGVTGDCQKGLFKRDALFRRKVIPHCLRSVLSIVRVLRLQKPCKLALDLDKIKWGYLLAIKNMENDKIVIESKQRETIKKN